MTAGKIARDDDSVQICYTCFVPNNAYKEDIEYEGLYQAKSFAPHLLYHADSLADYIFYGSACLHCITHR